MKGRSSILIVILASASVFAATPMRDYADRLSRAASIAGGLFDDSRDEPTDAEIAAALESIRGLFKSKEQVDFQVAVVNVDNGWMIESLDRLIRRHRTGEGTPEARYDELVELAGRVILLSNQVERAVEKPVDGVADKRATLEAILSRDEYRPEQIQESRLQKLISKLWSELMRALSRFAASTPETPTQTGTAQLDAVRVLIAFGLLAALVIGSIVLVRRLVRRWRLKEQGKGKEKIREVLGEMIDEDATTDDLLARAAELARSGDYRSAIRRAFVALLFELESRGKVRLDGAKTNRDYLNEVRMDRMLVGPMTGLTGIFERVWYGEQPASSGDYSDFMSGWPRLREVE